MKYSRKSFLKLLGLGGLAAATPAMGASTRNYSATRPQAANLELGLASYTTRSYSLDETIEMTKRLGMKMLCLKSMHLPLESSDADIKAAADKVTKAGLTLYGAGVIYMKSEDEVNNAFRYAKAAGIQTIIGVPNHELLPLVERNVKETNIKVAIHNHGPGDDVYPTPEVTYEKVKSLDARVGLCIDIGHVQRLKLDPVENLKKYADRLYDLHLKDVDQSAAAGRSVEFGRGVIDMPAVLQALREINYQGVMALEFEKDADDVIPGLAECVGYARGVMDVMG